MSRTNTPPDPAPPPTPCAGGSFESSVTCLELSRDSRFGAVQTLPGLPFQERARDILCSLANDTGVIACMRKHSWRVGALCELVSAVVGRVRVRVSAYALVAYFVPVLCIACIVY